DTCHCPRVLQAPSNLASTLPGIQGQPQLHREAVPGLTTLTGKNFFPLSHPSLPSGSGKPFP
ncbi:unnamed protein product, partial [Coccothraustes coccothraustes]